MFKVVELLSNKFVINLFFKIHLSKSILMSKKLTGFVLLVRTWPQNTLHLVYSMCMDYINACDIHTFMRLKKLTLPPHRHYW